MKVQKVVYSCIKTHSFDKKRMQLWRELNHIPDYVNASYTGPTGVKITHFPIYSRTDRFFPNIDKDLYSYEEEIIQELKDIRRKPFGYFRALWKMSQNFGTGEAWDSKFMPQFPGRDSFGRVQYAKYRGEKVSANDLSNIMYAHICAYMGIPKFLAKFIAKMDACGILEIISKGKWPTKNLLKFKDTQSDQIAIAKGMDDFNIKNYRLR